MVEHNQSSYYNNGYKFNGKELDEATGMYYYGARYYDPRISIFVSVDPLAEKTMEPYSYVGNNPIMFTDPTGMSKFGSGPGDPPPYHREYTVQQYINFFENCHKIKMTDVQKSILDLGCIGIVDLEIYNGNDMTGFARNKYTNTDFPDMKYSYSTLDKAVEVMNEHNSLIKDQDKPGRAFVFGVRYYEPNSKIGLPNNNGQIYMGNWKVQGIDSNAIPFDYGLYNERTGNFWHANHAQTNNPNDPMRIYESDNNYFSNQYPDAFNRTVYSVGFSPYEQGVDNNCE